MNNTIVRILLLAAVCLSAVSAAAVVRLPAIFSDGMVMQRESNANIWGWATPNAKIIITTSWDDEKLHLRSDADGRWHAALATPTAGGPHTITISDGIPTKLCDIMMGEVWICVGQSNMDMPMEGFKAQPVEGTATELMSCADSDLRLFTVKRNSSFVPVDTLSGAWQSAAAVSVRAFSAAAYYFGRQLRKTLDVPVGLIVAAWGGSSCETWMARQWFDAFPETLPENNLNRKSFYILPAEASDIRSKNRTPTLLYNGMLHPIIGYTMRGALWYQGEDNVPRYKSYARMMGTMIEGWRNDWGQGEFPFYYCQIAPYDYALIGSNFNSALLREQQQMVELRVPNTGMAVLMDAGLEKCIHPRKKREAGERLAMLALADTYGMKGLSKSARYESVDFKGDTAIVRFERSRMWVYFDGGSEGANFEVAGDDQVFHPAKAWVERNRVMVRSDKVRKPVAVRYAFKNWAVGDLFCDGLPVSSFRTDSWDVIVENSHAAEYDNR